MRNKCIEREKLTFIIIRPYPIARRTCHNRYLMRNDNIMSNILEYFEITKLYGFKNFHIPFKDNQIVLVGENGSGKSTVVTILYYLITCQWYKLLNYDFDSVSLKVNGNKHTIFRTDILNRKPSSQLSIRAKKIMYRLSELGLSPENTLQNYNSTLHRELTKDNHITAMAVRRALSEIIDLQPSIYEDSQGRLFEDANKSIQNFEKSIDTHALFLPTYRRIERDFKAIFPTIDYENGPKKHRKNPSDHKRKHFELVEFGMEDVDHMINDTMMSLDRNFRVSLDSLTGGYLRVILKKEYENTDSSLLEDIDQHALDEILQKIDKSVLSDYEQEALRKTIKKFGDRAPDSAIEKLSAHIITGLILLHKEQFEKEEKVRTFASVCNKYLKGKRFEFGNRDFTLPVRPVFDDDEKLDVSTLPDIELSNLSSGEKQIVSLFAHLYLSDRNDYFIIIDEPELSLSVPWQKTFLPDLLASGKCEGLVAVTHSPFIYNNELRNNAHSIQEFARN